MTASKSSLAAALCCLLLLGAFISSSESASCCLRYSRKPPPCRALQGYSIQTITGSCDIPAIIFLRKHGHRFVCADPAKMATVHRIRCLDDWTRRLAQANKGKLSNFAK